MAKKDVQYHLFDGQTTKYDVKKINPDAVYDAMAKVVVDWLIKNGVKPADYDEFSRRVISANLREDSKSFNLVRRKVKKLLAQASG